MAGSHTKQDLLARTNIHEGRVAYHEAAHVAVMAWFGWSIGPGGVQGLGRSHIDGAGGCFADVPKGGYTERAILPILLAGYLFLNMCEGRAISDEELQAEIANARNQREVEHDYPRAFMALLVGKPDASDEELIAAFRAYEAKTLAILQRPEIRRSIDAVAIALMERGELTASEAMDLVEPAVFQSGHSQRVEPSLALSLPSLFERHERVFLAFSGGKESVTLAHLCEPWRDQVTLLWVNTGFMFPHMVEFVRAYGERFKLVELASPNLIDHWQEHGLPAEVLPVEHAVGMREPRLQAWLNCCSVIRTRPIVDYLHQVAGSAALIHGQRLEDRASMGNAAFANALPAGVEVALPLRDWVEADVMAYIVEHGLVLPSHYAEVRDSLECSICPSQLTAAKMRYLKQNHPDIAPVVRSVAMQSLVASGEAAQRLMEAIDG